MNALVLEAKKELYRRELAKRRLLNFIIYTYPDYEVNWHHKLICETIDKWVTGEIKRLMIFAPPQNGKSVIVSERLPAYILGTNPRAKIIAVSYAQKLINKMSRKSRECIQGKLFQNIFPEVKLSPERSAVEEWETLQGGYYNCAGAGGGITGFGFTHGIIDDPLKGREAAESETIREGVNEWYKSDFYTRRQPGAGILIINTRWHQSDLSGMLLDAMEQDPKADKWVVIDLPAILDRDPMKGDPRQKGEALWPTRYSLRDLESTKTTLGAYDWEALYQQRPQPPGGGKIKRTWFKHTIDKAPDDLYWLRFWDLAVSTKTSADYTASIAGALDDDGNFYLRDMVRGRWEWPDTHKILIQTAKSENIPIGVEVAGQQGGFVDELYRDPELQNISIEGIRPDKDKLTRALPWIARAQAGKVYLVGGNWINEFLNECQSFTGHGDKYDDQIDTVSGVYQMCSDHVRPEIM